jgi:hypothetical protein
MKLQVVIRIRREKLCRRMVLSGGFGRGGMIRDIALMRKVCRREWSMLRGIVMDKYDELRATT